MRTAIISDIHANLEALLAVLEDIDKQNVDRIICLGDLVDYGPDPAACLDLVREKAKIIIAGNHDIDYRHDGTIFSFRGKPLPCDQPGIGREWVLGALQPRVLVPKQELSTINPIKWLQNLIPKYVQDTSRTDFLRSLHLRYEEDGALYVHGCPVSGLEPIIYQLPITPMLISRNGINILEFSEDANKSYERLCFIGHTHVAVHTSKPQTPTVVVKGNRVIKISEIADRVTFNVGSVGQPRDGDNRACYVVYDSNADTVEYRRISYDFRTTQQKIINLPINRMYRRAGLGHEIHDAARLVTGD